MPGSGSNEDFEFENIFNPYLQSTNLGYSKKYTNASGRIKKQVTSVNEISKSEKAIIKAHIENIKDYHQYTSLHLSRLNNLPLQDLIDEMKQIALKINQEQDENEIALWSRIAAQNKAIHF